MAEMTGEVTLTVHLEPDARVKQLIAQEVKRQLDEHYVKARMGTHMGNPMYHPTDTRGLPLPPEEKRGGGGTS